MNKKVNITKILESLKDEIGELEYNRYIKNLAYDEGGSNDHKIILYAANPLVQNWIKNRYAQKIEEVLNAHFDDVSVEILLKGEKNKKGKKRDTKSDQRAMPSLLNPSHTFENFIVGGSNQFAYATIKSASEKPGVLYNPIFIYGGVGLGKTHLMQAAGNYLHSKGKVVIYTTVEQFLNDFIRHVRNKSMEKFQDKYRKCDVLLIDDIQFLSNKEGIQEEFFHTFEALRGEGKQIILTADKHPKKIAGLEKRLQSRFEHGLVADIQPPELETKIAIIKNKCQINKVHLNSEIINYIATVIESNVREIEGILAKLHAYSKLMNVDITIEFTKNVLRDQIQENRANLTLDMINASVAKDLNIKPSEIRSKSRSKNIVLARRIAIYLGRNLTQNTMPQLAQYFGMKDHTAISHTLKKIAELIESDEDFKVKIDELSNKIKSSQ